ncbi:MAG: hypothetical protein IKJ74_03635 [Clostridia bacterium]|nr:hypothetical protein [Clostridia bacterium]
MAFNKRIFSILLTEAKGERSWRQFAMDCDISYIQMRKLALGQQENSPRKKLMTKIAQNAAGGITLEDLMFCSGAGIEAEEKKTSGALSRSGDLINEKFQTLSMGQRKMVLDFIDFLVRR